MKLVFLKIIKGLFFQKFAPLYKTASMPYMEVILKPMDVEMAEPYIFDFFRNCNFQAL